MSPRDAAMGGEPMGRPTDTALWGAVESTLVDVVLPALADEHARLAAIQLVGLARYARERGPDPTAARIDELTTALDGLAANPLVAPHWTGSPDDRGAVLAACAAALRDAVGRDDVAAAEVRERLRPLLVGQLDDDLAAGAVLGAVFRGRLPDA